MGRARVCFSVAACAAALVALSVRAQTPDPARYVIQANVGLPAVDEGILVDDSHTPTSDETRHRVAVRSVLHADAVGSSGVPYKRGRMLVKFKDDASAPARLAALASALPGGVIGQRPSHADFDVVNIDPTEDAEAAARELGKRPEVEYAQPAYRVRTMFVPNDPFYKSSTTFTPGQWNLPLIGLEAAWDIQPQAGSTITVAVLDTGMAYMSSTLTIDIPSFVDDDGVRYPALGRTTIPYSAASQLVSPGRIVAPRDFIWDNTQPLDYDGHGTHVAGTVGQLTNDGIGTAGVAFNVKLMPVKVIDSVWDDIFGAPNFGTDGEVARGIRYAADNGAKVINMSIGRTGPPNTAPAVEDAIRYAVGRGVVVVVAAGNEFEDGNPREIYAEIASRIPGAIAVAAVDRNATVGDHHCTGSSSSPSCHAYYSSTGSYVELAAPGGSERGYGRDGLVWQQTFDFNFVETYLLPVNQYRAPRFDVHAYVGYIGTSMAVPHVSGVAAMLMQQGITDPAAVEAALEKFAVDLGAAGRDDLYGFGLVDARNALRGLGIAR
jgi:serine protease